MRERERMREDRRKNNMSETKGKEGQKDPVWQGSMLGRASAQCPLPACIARVMCPSLCPVELFCKGQEDLSLFCPPSRAFRRLGLHP